MHSHVADITFAAHGWLRRFPHRKGKEMTKTIFGLACFLIAIGGAMGSANAQATRTWVSGVGDDANPCSRTAPCKTFAGAISKTAANGEISVLDPGGFGAVTITKSITINGDGTLAGILASLVNGVIINAGVNDKIVLRNLSFNGAGNGINGIRFLAGAQLTVERCTIEGFTGNGIDVAKTASGEVYVTNTHITEVNNGIRLATTAGFLTVGINNVTIVNTTTNGIDSATNGIFASVDRSNIVSSGANGIVVSAGNGTINVNSSMVTNNVTGVNAAITGSTIRISDNIIYNNGTDLAAVAGATVASDGTNRTGPSSGAVIPSAITLK